MTTIIVIVVVALVFFVSICVAAFMVWKRESEMRTDSIRAIERKLERLGADLMDNSEQGTGRQEEEPFDRERNRSRIFRQRSRDPFSWMRTEDDQGHEAGKHVSELFEDDLIQSTEEYFEKDCVGNDSGIAEEVSENDKTFSGADSGPNEKEKIYADIDLDFAEIQNLVSEIRDTDSEKQSSQEGGCLHEPPAEEQPETDPEISDGDMEAFTEVKKSPMSHNIGKSGREYTAEELETLIKE